jgi:hypothetical protein
MPEASPEPELQGLGIVAMGSFNPAIFQPFWFSGNRLIREEEAKDANVEIIHHSAAIFSTSWFSVRVLENRFELDTSDPTMFQPTRDLILGTFRVLEHTPIDVFGFNRHQHFRMESEEAWHAFGHYYAPKTSWESIVTQPGMASLSISGKREHAESKRVVIKIEPSARLHPGVYIQATEDYAIDKDKSQNDQNYFFLQTVSKVWDDFVAYSDRVPKHLLTEFKKNQPDK